MENVSANPVINNLINFIFNPELSGIFLLIKIIFVIVSATLIINIFFLILASSWFKLRFKNEWNEFYQFKPLEATEISQKWEKVNKRLETDSEAEHKLAVLEADELLTKALKMDGYDGDDLEEQLRRVDSSDIEDIKPSLRAHLFRNKLVEEPDIKIDLSQAKKAVEDFKKAYEEIQEY